MRFASRRLLQLWSYDASTLTDEAREGYGA
jgi:hypothetical protein